PSACPGVERRGKGRSLALESGPQFDELRFPLRLDRTSEVEEDFESGGTRLVKELEAAGGGAVHVAVFHHGEHRRQLLLADVQVQRFGLDVEELARRAETAELPVHFNP